jgi:hypothetical protein
MDLYAIVLGVILLFPWSLVLVSVTGAILQRRKRWTGGPRATMAGGRDVRHGAERSQES